MSPPVPSFLRRLSAVLASDLSEQSDLVELTFMIVLRNLVAKIQTHSTNVDLMLRIIVPYLILLAGIYGTFSQRPTVHGIITSLWELATARFSWKVTVPAYHPLNAEVLTWLASRGLARNAHQLALTHKQPNNTEEAMDMFGEGFSARDSRQLVLLSQPRCNP
jgi:hypothetical protein